MAIEQDQLLALSKQVFITDYLLNGLFPCQSDVVRLLRNKKKAWDFNDKFEYRMLLANTNTGGSLNSQVYNQNVSLVKPGSLEYGLFKATYGTITDGFNVDMMLNLETKEKKAAFETDYATRMHSMRNNVASLFKNFAIHGRYGVVHQLRASIDTDMTAKYGTAYEFTDMRSNPRPNCMTEAEVKAATNFSTANDTRVPFTIKVPINVFNSNFKAGKLLIKTKLPVSGDSFGPGDPADVSELYQVIDNQPGLLTLIPIGTSMSAWQDGEFLEVAQNREIASNSDEWQKWSGSITVDETFTNAKGETGVQTPVAWQMLNIAKFTGTGSYTADTFISGTGKFTTGITGAMEGLADLLPWYSDPAHLNKRLGIELPFRGQSDRLRYTTEQCGGYVVQEETEHIIDAIMRGAFLTKSTVPYADIGIWINPVTRIQMGYEEGAGVQVLRDNFVAGPIVYQRGVKTTDYQIGNQVIKEVVEDLNMPTDVIIIGPKNDMSYNCWDNATMEIDKYIQDTWSKSEPPRIQDLQLPSELVTSLDISKRITFGSPTLADASNSIWADGSGIRHPKNVMPVAMHEMGALYTEHPYAYTVVKLRKPIADIITV